MVWRLDRLGRSVSHLIEQSEDLQARGVGFVSIQEAIDTTAPGGRLVFHVFSALAQFERDLIVERTTAGLAAARARGRVGGRRSCPSSRWIPPGRCMSPGRSVSPRLGGSWGQSIDDLSIFRQIDLDRAELSALCGG